MLVQPDTREDYGADRWIGIGTSNGRVAVVAFAERGGRLYPYYLFEKGKPA